MRSILSKLNSEVCYMPPDQMHRHLIITIHPRGRGRGGYWQPVGMGMFNRGGNGLLSMWCLIW